VDDAETTTTPTTTLAMSDDYDSDYDSTTLATTTTSADETTVRIAEPLFFGAGDRNLTRRPECGAAFSLTRWTKI
jgi:hypothetical protein